MSAYFQPGSMSADLVVHREIDERIRQARADKMARAANPRTARRISLLGLLPARLLSMVGQARLAPAPRMTRQAAKG